MNASQSLISFIKHKWSDFWTNFCWSDYVSYIDGWIPKLSFSVPIIGYVILFNDTVSQSLSYDAITNNEATDFGLSGIHRLRFLYFGLIALGVSNIIYRIRRPYGFRFGTDFVQYSKTGLEAFMVSSFTSMHHDIQVKGPSTLEGKYKESDWDAFIKEATKTKERGNSVQRFGSWEAAKLKYGDLLRNILYETFFNEDTGRRCSLVTCLFFSTIGYVALMLPSIDLFLKVIITTFG
ncbi:MAG: hypothetical protein ACFE0O_06200 [Opitutales bacterium]